MISLERAKYWLPATHPENNPVVEILSVVMYLNLASETHLYQEVHNTSSSHSLPTNTPPHQPYVQGIERDITLIQYWGQINLVLVNM